MKVKNKNKKNPPGMFSNFFHYCKHMDKAVYYPFYCKIQIDLILTLGSFNFLPFTFHSYVSIHIPIYGVVLDYIHF